MNSPSCEGKFRQVVIYVTEKDPEVQKRMAAFGMTDKRLQEGNTLLNNAKLLKNTVDNHYEDRWTIAQQIEANQQTCRSAFREHADVVRIAFRNEPVLLHGLKIQRISKRKWDWTEQALHFYTLIEVHAARLKPFGISKEVITQAKASVEALIALKNDRMKQKGLTEDSTLAKREAFQALKRWVQEFRTTARFAYKDNPQRLEMFGIPVSSKV